MINSPADRSRGLATNILANTALSDRQTPFKVSILGVLLREADRRSPKRVALIRVSESQSG
jgi:hypothetical protein